MSLYAADELAALAILLGAAGFPGADEALPADGEAREAALRAARRSLLARGVLEIDDEGVLRVLAPHAELVAVALGRVAAVSIERRTSDSLDRRSLYVADGAGVEHAAELGHVHRLERFDASELEQRVLALAAIAQTDESGEELEATPEELDVALARAGRGEQVDGALGELLRTLQSLGRVTALRRTDGKLVGGEVMWLDLGGAGLRVVEPSGQGDRVRLRPASGAAVADEVRSYIAT
jgi:hypothetical protein